MQEKIVEIKVCKHCNTNFEITDKDLEFYEKISPIFAGKKYNIPAPTFCPDCRQQRRLSFRNERKLYKRKCDTTGKDIISIYSPDKKYKVYHQDYWWSDKWDPMKYGFDFDFSKSFFEQFEELMIFIPLLSIINRYSENSSHTNLSAYNTNCYLLFESSNNDSCFYSYQLQNCKNCVDSYFLSKSENCFGVSDSENCFNVKFSQNSDLCNDSYFLYNCKGCGFCFGCVGCNNKTYHIFNEPKDKNEYEKFIKDFNKMNLFQKNYILNKIISLREKSPVKYAEIININDCSGDYIKNSSNCKSIYESNDSSNCAYCTQIFSNTFYCMDSDTVDYNSFLVYESTNTALRANYCCFSNICWECNSIFYSYQCFNSSNLFGCIGLRNKSYCILNKQYSKEEYEILVPKIIEHMQKNGEWGEFFPSNLSSFGYNETVAMEYFPLTKEEAIKKGFKWSDYEAPFSKVEKIIPANKLPENIKDIPDDILNWAVECEITKKPFRIIKQELEFYRKNNLPIPRRHPDQRHLDRIALRNPRKLYDRKCAKCHLEMKTSYSPERKEIVYCEECYNNEVY